MDLLNMGFMNINQQVAEVADALWYCFYAYTPTQIRANDVTATRGIRVRGNSYVLNFDGHVSKQGEVDYVTVTCSVYDPHDEFVKVYKPKTFNTLQETAFAVLSHFHVP